MTAADRPTVTPRVGDTITIIEPACPLCRRVGAHARGCLENLSRLVDPCAYGQHRWAWFTAGGQACGRCGVAR